jgi:DNA mismatch repair protein MutS2
MLQCGFLIPASEISELGIFKNIFIDIGDAQSIENDLSTYSSHLTDMKFFMKNADPHTLILIDEFGSGTEPDAGGAIAEAALADILKKEAFGVITTHYINLKHFASSNEGIVNGAMLFDTQNFIPLFKLETGMHGSSFAFEIARKIGIPTEIIKEAEAKLSQTQVKMEKNFREITRDKRYWEQKRENIRKTNKHIEELSEEYEKKLIEIKDFRKKLIEEAKAEAKKILASANREIENTIRTIKESQAEKESTKAARIKLQEFNAQIDESRTAADDKIEHELRKIRERQTRMGNKQHKSISVAEQSASQDSRLQPGDKVKIEGQTAVGEVISVGNSNVAVAVGNIIMNIIHDRLVKISHGEYKNSFKNSKNSQLPVSSDLSVKRLNFKPFLDVRGQRTIDALEQVTCFIDEAIILEMNEIRILHGKGNGILKVEIRNYLKTLGNIIRFSDESEESGGAGITVVRLG